MLSSLRDDAGGVAQFNVLEFFSEMDMRFFPITADDREAAVDAYSSFAWDPAASFSVNWSDIENRVEEIKRRLSSRWSGPTVVAGSDGS